MLEIYRYDAGRLQRVDDIGPQTWVRLVEPDDAEMELVSRTCGVGKAHLDAILDLDELARAELVEEALCIIANVPVHLPGHDDEMYGTIPVSLIITPEHVVTSSSSKIDVYDDIVDQEKTHLDPSDRVSFVCRLLLLQAVLYQRYLREIDTERQHMIGTLGRRTSNADLIRLHELESSLVYLEQGLRGNKMAFDLLSDEEHLARDRKHAGLIKEVMLETEQSIEMASIYRELVRSTRELFASALDNSLNSVMKILTSLTIILAVPTIIGGLYGMNVPVEGMPFGTMASAFAIIIGITALLCLIIAWVLHRRDLL